MKIFTNKNDLLKTIDNEKNLGFVPTMGTIHAGHISLIKKSKSQSKKTIVTIFINKPQFNKKKDFAEYPRNLARDIDKLKKVRVNYLYLPKIKEIYPRGINKSIKISLFSKKLCGKFRPGHFESVVDVLDRFIKIIRPKKIFLGEKDMQQLKIVDIFVKQNYKKIKVVACKTVREKNGIAKSSRNILLLNKEKKIASKIYHLIKNKKKYLINKKFSLESIKKEIKNIGVKNIDYLEIININRISKPYFRSINYKIFIAYYLGTTRIIDNI